MRQADTSELEAVSPTARPRDASSRSKLPRSSNDRDRILIAAVAQRDQTAFRELHLRYHPRIARFVSASFPQCKTTEEIINDTLWIVWRSAGRFRGASKISTWIMGIAYNVGLKSLGESGQRLAELRGLRDFGEAPHNPESQRDIREWIAAGLARLPVEQRTVLELAYHLGQSCTEIAGILNCPVGTVKTRMHYGRQKLRLLLPNLAGSRGRLRKALPGPHQRGSQRIPNIPDMTSGDQPEGHVDHRL